jgi:hypothetical protein
MARSSTAARVAESYDRGMSPRAYLETPKDDPVVSAGGRVRVVRRAGTLWEDIANKVLKRQLL